MNRATVTITWLWFVASISIVALMSLVLLQQPVAAAQTAPYKLHYQGSLSNSSGAPMADGSYNMKFRLFSAATGGTAVWTETRQTTSRVVVTNGQFAVQLGDVTPLSPSLFTTTSVYLEVELPTPATVTCATTNCGTYTEGAMTPRQPMASSAYAMNADTLDGYDASSFIIASQNNTYTGTNTFKNTIDSATAFDIQSADGSHLFMIDTAAGDVNIGKYAISSPVSFGRTSFGSTTDFGDVESINTSRYQTGSTAGDLSSLSVHVGTSLDTNKIFRLAVYTDTGSAPGTLVAQSIEGALVSGWNTVAISGNLLPNTNYWIAYMTNGSGPTNNNMTFSPGGTSCYTTMNYTNGFPSTMPACTAGTQDFAMYGTFTATSNVPVTIKSNGLVGIGTVSPSDTLTVAGTGLFKNKVDSANSFRIQNAAAATLFVVDTANSRIQIGSSTADSVAIALVLDTKNTSGDPTGVNGAMYYNSATSKFRCYENNTWKNCIGGQNTAQVTSDVTSDATANVLKDATGLSFAVVAGQTYRFSALIDYTSAATTTGSRWTLSGPAASQLSYTSTYTLTATSQTVSFASAYGIPAASNLTSLTSGNVARIDGIIKPTANGTVQVQFASEVAASAITAKAGSSLTWW
ncbi:MAG: hypothetical protein ABIR91_00625 [Candidatus Saccharimonadales bacterium]